MNMLTSASLENKICIVCRKCEALSITYFKKQKLFLSDLISNSRAVEKKL